MTSKHIEMGLGRFNPQETGAGAEVEDGKYEEENKSSREKGADLMKRTWGGIGAGFKGLVSRARAGGRAVLESGRAVLETAAGTPYAIGEAMRSAHEKGGEVKASIVDSIDAGVGKVADTMDAGKEAALNMANEAYTSSKETLNAGKEAVVTKAKDTYKNLETRTVNAGNRWLARSREIAQSARNKWESLVELKRRQEFEKLRKQQREISVRLVEAAKAANIDGYTLAELLPPGEAEEEEQIAA